MTTGKSAAFKLLEKLAAAEGGTVDLSVIEKLRQGSNYSTKEAETVLRSLHKPHAYVKKRCKRQGCDNIFETNYCSVSYCSDQCIAADMRALGLDYDPYRMKRWESSMYN